MKELSLKEKYERMSVFYFLKNGKHLIRRGLINRILFLCFGSKKHHVFRSSVLQHEIYDRSFLMRLNINNEELEKLKLVCNFYLETCDVRRETIPNFYNAFYEGILIHYKKENIRWDLLDRDLISLYPKDVVIKNNIPHIKNYRTIKHVNPNHIFNITNVPEVRKEDGDSSRTKN
jgi:hypothetical protein